MDDAKKQKITLGLVLSFLLLLPLGQFAKLNLTTPEGSITPLIIDLNALVSVIFLLWYKKYLNKYKIFLAFIGFAFFSLLINFFTLGLSDLRSFLYLIRLFSYFSLFVIINNSILTPSKRETIIKYILFSIVIAAVVGWIQYIFFPDLTALKYLGWDDHLYRLAGSFLDPGFTGIILTVGILLSLGLFYKRKQKYMLFILLFLLLSMLFTYSRASFLALISGFLYLSISKGIEYRKYLLVLILVPFVLLMLPRRGGVGVELERVFSVYARVENYKETIQIWKASPLIGVGYNNICSIRLNLSENIDPQSHACSGADSSFLFILATTGTIGFIVFVGLIIAIWENIGGSIPLATKSILISLFTHSFFVNSLFYAFILGLLSILLGVSYKVKEYK